MNTNVDVEKLDGGEEQQNEYAAARGARFADGQSLAEYTTNASEKAGSSRYAGSESGLEHVKASKTAERKLVRKLGAFAINHLCSHGFHRSSSYLLSRLHQ